MKVGEGREQAIGLEQENRGKKENGGIKRGKAGWAIPGLSETSLEVALSISASPTESRCLLRGYRVCE